MPPAAAAQTLQPSNTRLLGVVLALLGAGLFATKGIVIKLAMLQHIDAMTTLTWRMIVAVPIFVTVGILGYRRKAAQRSANAPAVLDNSTLLQTLGVGLLGYYIASYLDFSALTYISAQFDRLILLTYPFFVVLFGAVFFGRKVTPLMIGSLVVSYFGIALIFWHDFSIEGDNVLLGAALVFGSAVVYAAYQILAKPLIDKMGAQLFTSVAMSAAGPAVIVHFLLTHPFSALAMDGHGSTADARHRHGLDGTARLLHLGRHRPCWSRAHRHHWQCLPGRDGRPRHQCPRRELYCLACPRHGTGPGRRRAIQPEGQGESAGDCRRGMTAPAAKRFPLPRLPPRARRTWRVALG